MKTFTPATDIKGLTLQAQSLSRLLQNKEADIARLKKMLDDANAVISSLDERAISSLRDTNERLTNLLETTEAKLLCAKRNEPCGDDIANLRAALTHLGFSSPESNECLGNEWMSHIRKLLRRINKQ